MLFIFYRTIVCILTVRYIFHCAKIYIFNKCWGCGLWAWSDCSSFLSLADARPDFAELDVFLGQHILLSLEQHFNQKM